jgi:hypothetical protein
MKKSLFLKSMQVPEIVVLVIFILYLIFPVSTPGELSPYIESPLGVIVLLVMIVALFLYSHPLVAVLFLFVAYTLLRRSAAVKPTTSYIEQTLSSEEKMKEAKKELEMATPPHQEVRHPDLKASQPKTLEEEVVAKHSPIGVSEKISVVETSFLPVSTNVKGTSSA